MTIPVGAGYVVTARETIEVDSGAATVSCDGGSGVFGHPRVYLSLGSASGVDCYYCGRRFVRRGSAPQEAAPRGSVRPAERQG